MAGLNKKAYMQALLESTPKSLCATLEYFFQRNPKYRFRIKEMILILGLLQRKMIERVKAKGDDGMFFI